MRDGKRFRRQFRESSNDLEDMSERLAHRFEAVPVQPMRHIL